jgi:hypothetical protein
MKERAGQQRSLGLFPRVNVYNKERRFPNLRNVEALVASA